MNTYLAMDLLRTLYIKRKTIGRPAHPHLESLRRPPRDYKGTYGRKKALKLYIQGAPHQEKEYKEEEKL